MLIRSKVVFIINYTKASKGFPDKSRILSVVLCNTSNSKYEKTGGFEVKILVLVNKSSNRYFLIFLIGFINQSPNHHKHFYVPWKDQRNLWGYKYPQLYRTFKSGRSICISLGPPRFVILHHIPQPSSLWERQDCQSLGNRNMSGIRIGS